MTDRMNKFGPKAATGAHGFKRFRPSPAELRRAVLAIPLDTRDLTARFCGDPLPTRSALDRKQAGK